MHLYTLLLSQPILVADTKIAPRRCVIGAFCIIVRWQPGVNGLFAGVFIVPVLGDGLGAGIEAHAVQAKHMLVAEERVLVAGEREIRRGHGDADVDADHAAVGKHFKLAGIVAALRKDGRAVGERVSVHDGQPLFKRLDTLDERDRPKDLARADGHIGRHMVKDRRADEEAVLIARHYDIAPVEHELRSVVDAALDPVANGLLVLGAHDRAELRLGVIGAADLHRHCLLLRQRNKLVGNGFLDHNDRKCHAAHTGAAISRIDDGIGP